jgi:transposase
MPTLAERAVRQPRPIGRHGSDVYYGGRAWTGRHDLWLPAQHRAAVFTTCGSSAPTLGMAFDIAYDTVGTVARRDRLDATITAMAASEHTPVVQRLCCLRGAATLTAFGLAVEIGDWHRLTGRGMGAYLGLVPSESSSGASRSQGSNHQDRQRPRPQAADRSRLASPHALAAHRGAAPPPRRGRPGRP